MLQHLVSRKNETLGYNSEWVITWFGNDNDSLKIGQDKKLKKNNSDDFLGMIVDRKL